MTCHVVLYCNIPHHWIQGTVKCTVKCFPASTSLYTHPASIWRLLPPEPCSSGPTHKGKGHRARPCWPHPPRCSGAVRCLHTGTGTWRPDLATHQSEDINYKMSMCVLSLTFIKHAIRSSPTSNLHKTRTDLLRRSLFAAGADQVAVCFQPGQVLQQLLGRRAMLVRQIMKTNQQPHLGLT